MGKFEDLKLIKKTELKKSFYKMGFRKFIFKVKRKEFGRVTRGPKLAMQKVVIHADLRCKWDHALKVVRN